MQVACELWSINRWLRYTGFRLFIEIDATTGAVFDPQKPTRIGIRFFG